MRGIITDICIGDDDDDDEDDKLITTEGYTWQLKTGTR